MKQLIALVLSGILSLGISAQETTNYTGLKSKGAIPEDFTKLTLKKIEDANAQTAGNESKAKKRADSEFYEKSNFGIDELLQSGRVCFKDTISSYVEEVFEEIRSKNHDIPSNLRIYTVKSPVVNAFTTDQGIIFINTGLLAQLENEAQLAFVLCHEIIHYMENHVMEGFIENQEIQSGKNDYKKIKTVDKELASTRFSRKMETEADKKGLVLFLNTDYNPAEVDGVFDVLLYSYLPFDELKFDSSILEIGNYEIPDKYFLTELKEIEVDEDEDDSRHTHPNIAKRRKKADAILINEKQTGKNFIISEADFYTVRAAARYEVLRLQLVSGDYSEALYSAFILEQEFPENPLPKIAIGEILYGTALFANTNNRKKVTGYYKKRQGNVQQAYYILNKIPSQDMTVLAARYNYYLHGLYPENETIEKRLENLFEDLVYHHGLSFDDLIFDSSNADTTKNNATKKATVKKVSSKYDRIKSSKSTKKSSTSDYKDWELSIFSGCDCEDDIEKLFETGKTRSEKKKYNLAETDDDELNKQSEKESKQYEKMKRKKGRSLDIDKIVIIDPFYGIINQSKKDGFKQVKSELEEVDQLDQLDKMALKCGLGLEILTNYRFATDDVQKFNDFSLLNEWVNERFMMEDRSAIISSTEEIQELVERYNTKYFGWTGVINSTHKRNNRGLVLLLSIYSIVGIPYGIYYMTVPAQSTYIYFALFNVETGELVLYEDRVLKGGDNAGLLNTHYYDIFHQIKN